MSMRCSPASPPSLPRLSAPACLPGRRLPGLCLPRLLRRLQKRGARERAALLRRPPRPPTCTGTSWAAGVRRRRPVCARPAPAEPLRVDPWRARLPQVLDPGARHTSELSGLRPGGGFQPGEDQGASAGVWAGRGARGGARASSMDGSGRGEPLLSRLRVPAGRAMPLLLPRLLRRNRRCRRRPTSAAGLRGSHAAGLLSALRRGGDGPEALPFVLAARTRCGAGRAGAGQCRRFPPLPHLPDADPRGCWQEQKRMRCTPGRCTLALVPR